MFVKRIEDKVKLKTNWNVWARAEVTTRSRTKCKRMVDMVAAIY